MLWRPRKAVKKLLYCTCRTLTKEIRVLIGGETKDWDFPQEKKTKDHRFFGKIVCFGRILLSPFVVLLHVYGICVGRGQKCCWSLFRGVENRDGKNETK